MDNYIIEYSTAISLDSNNNIKSGKSGLFILNSEVININDIIKIISIIFNSVCCIVVRHNNNIVFSKDKIECEIISYDELEEAIFKRKIKNIMQMLHLLQ